MGNKKKCISWYVLCSEKSAFQWKNGTVRKYSIQSLIWVFGKAKLENRCFYDKMKSIVLSNYVINDAEKKKLINEWEINKR